MWVTLKTTPSLPDGLLEFRVTSLFILIPWARELYSYYHIYILLKLHSLMFSSVLMACFFCWIKRNMSECACAHTHQHKANTCLCHTHSHCKNTHGCPANRERPTAYHTHAITHSPCCLGKMELEAEEWIKSTLTLSQSFLLADGIVILLVWNYPETLVRDHEIHVKSFYMVKYYPH